MTPNELRDRMNDAAEMLGGVWGLDSDKHVRMNRPRDRAAGDMSPSEYCPLTALADAELGLAMDPDDFDLAGSALGLEAVDYDAMAYASDNSYVDLFDDEGASADSVRAYRAAMMEVVGS